MYEQHRIYKFQLQTGINYTAEVLEEDSINIKIKTIRGEILILNKQTLNQSKLLEGEH